MKLNRSMMRWITTLVVVGVVAGGILSVAPLGAFAQDEGGVATPTPSNDGEANDPYDCEDFETVEEVRAVFADEAPGDNSELDTNDNDIPCEDKFGGQTEPVTATAADTPTTTETEEPTPTATETEEPTETETAAETTTEETTEAETTTEETTEAETTTEETTEAETTTEAKTEQPTASVTSENRSTTAEATYYQVDFVRGEPIENLDWPNGTYTNDQLIRFAHGSSDEAITRRSEGEFTTDEALAERIDSQDIEVANGTANITFTVTDGESVTLSLVSYTKPDPTWDPEDEDDQVFIDAETETFESGTHTLTVDLPDAGATDEDHGSDTDD